MKIKALLKSVFTGNVRPTADEPTAIAPDVAKLQEDLRLARCAHLAAARRISTFGQEQPELYRLYFTRAGEKVRKGQLHDAA